MALMDKVKGILGIPEDADEMYDDENLIEGEGGEDIAEESEDIEDILRNSDEHTEREIEVPKVVG